jgi:hypothetical protein
MMVSCPARSKWKESAVGTAFYLEQYRFGLAHADKNTSPLKREACSIQ